MSEIINSAMSSAKDKMNSSVEHLQAELVKIRTGKASPSMLDGIKIDYYGTMTPLAQVANLSTPDSKTIAIQPWEKPMLANIEQAIFAANLGLTPMNDGEFVRITIPPLTEERRKDLVKQSKALGEETKVSIRNERQKVMNIIKAEVKNGFPEDQGKKVEGTVEGLVKSFGEKIGQYIEAKEKSIMKV